MAPAPARSFVAIASSTTNTIFYKLSSVKEEPSKPPIRSYDEMIDPNNALRHRDLGLQPPLENIGELQKKAARALQSPTLPPIERERIRNCLAAVKENPSSENLLRLQQALHPATPGGG